MQTAEEIWQDEDLIKLLLEDGVVVMPTDTIYGLVGRAESEHTVSRIYTIRNRDPQKPCIILIGDRSELGKFSVSLSEQQEQELQKYWPGPVSVVLYCPSDSFYYLHRGTKTLAFRLPAPPALRKLLLTVGPLIAPSANKETCPPSYNIASARSYFGEAVDLYMDAGEQRNKASKLIRLQNDGSVIVLRE